jgi:predicted nuclease of predicted toxin-antitoxin system
VLLLDEMLPPALAEHLTAAGCETLAISADPALRGIPDDQVLALAAEHGRILVTDNIRDFVPLSNMWVAQGRSHPGILLISSRSFPMTSSRVGGIARALLRRHEADVWPTAGQFEFLT